MAKKSLLPSDDDLRLEFHRLCAERDRIEEEAKPHRDAYDDKRAELMELEKRELDPLISKMQSAEDGLHDIKQELATISRALKGQTGAPPSSPGR